MAVLLAVLVLVRAWLLVCLFVRVLVQWIGWSACWLIAGFDCLSVYIQVLVCLGLLVRLTLSSLSCACAYGVPVMWFM